MIPLRLSLKNFMCYRAGLPPLDLSGIRVACLCGDNGHGKTALLDAMTWALWGKARARPDRNGSVRGPSQEELVHQGEQDMMVELEFAARDQRYRVNRRHSRAARSKQGQTMLDLYVSSGNGFRPITGNSIRETEARICDLLHMDYQTFVNTAFLLQGQADLFTRSSPAKRKEMLAEVLDLSRYERLEESAKEKSRAIRDSVRSVESAIAMRQSEIAEADTYEAELASVKVSLAAITPRTEAERLHVSELRAAMDSLEGRRAELAELTTKLPTRREEVANLDRQVAAYSAKIAEFEATLARDSEIREQFAELEAARAHLGRLEQASFQFHRLDQERARLKGEIAVQRERLSGQIAQLRWTISNGLEPMVQRIPEIEERSRESASEQAGLDELDRQLLRERDEAQAISAKVGYLEEANASLKAEMEKTRRKFDMLDQDEALCPLCKTPLGPDGQDHLRREYEAEGREAKRQFQENVAGQETLRQRHGELAVQVSTQERELGRKRQELQTRVANLDRDLDEGRKAQAQLQTAAGELATLEAHLADEKFAERERGELARLDADVERLEYDHEAHHRAQEKEKALEEFGDLHRKLLEAAEALPVEREALDTTRELLGRGRRDIGETEGRCAALESELQSLPTLENQYAEAQSSFEALDGQRQSALVRQGVLENQLERVARLKVELGEHEERRRKLDEERRVYDELAVAFGKNGIQALIIETAIPQLQDDANELLGRLTEQRMAVKLQLQEGRKVVGLASEELQILISDEIGTRSYETFSGGEAFRVDFALRIALSKLLARRSGAPLPTLFIDEGFGSQDATGQERLKEAIQLIQADFEKILVITHVEEVKEAFPTRIEVTKTANGSTFVVV